MRKIKTTKPLDTEAFNIMLEFMPTKIDFKTMVIFKERIRLCASCIYLAKDNKCSKCDCSFYDKIFNIKKQCPIKKF